MTGIRFTAAMEWRKIKQLKEGVDMKKVYMGLICSLLFVGVASAANIAVWYGTESSPQTYINSSGVIYAPSFVGAMTISDATISGNATVSGAITGATLKVTGAAVVGSLTTTAGDGLAYTNHTVSGTLTPIVVTNVSVSGGVLSGIGIVVTNATVAGAALSGVSTVLTNVTVTPVAIVTNVTFTSVIITNANFDVTNVYTIYTGAAMQTADISLTLESGTPVVSAPSITLQSGTPAVSTVSISKETVASGAVAVTFTPSTGSFVKP